MLNFKYHPITEKNQLYVQFAEQFASASVESLVSAFNRGVGNPGFNNARAAHDMALMTELRRRGIDVSAVDDGQAVSFARKVALDATRSKLMKVD